MKISVTFLSPRTIELEAKNMCEETILDKFTNDEFLMGEAVDDYCIDDIEIITVTDMETGDTLHISEYSTSGTPGLAAKLKEEVDA